MRINRIPIEKNNEACAKHGGLFFIYILLLIFDQLCIELIESDNIDFVVKI